MVGRVGAGVGEGDVWGGAGVAEQGGVVGAVEELSEEGCFVGGEVEAVEVVELGRDGDEEFLGEDQSRARGCLDENFDPVAAAVGGDDVALQEDVRAKFCECLFVDFAVVLASCGQEAGFEILQDAQAEVLEYVKRKLLQQMSESLLESEQESRGVFEAVLLHELPKRKQQIRRHRIREIKARFHIRILLQLSGVSRQSGRRISRRITSDDFPGPEIHILGHLTRRRIQSDREWDVESGEIVLDDVDVVEGHDAVVDRFVGAGVGIGFTVSAQSVFGFDDDDALPGIRKTDGTIGTRRAAADNTDIAGDDVGGGVGCYVDFGREVGCEGWESGGEKEEKEVEDEGLEDHC